MNGPNRHVWVARLLSGLVLLGPCVGLSFLLLRCDEAIIHKKNVTRDEALTSTSVPLPVSARNIYCYLKAEGWQGITRFVRFDVEPAELQSAVEAILAYTSTGLKRELTFERRELSMISEEQLGTPQTLSQKAGLDWWNPDSITRGYYQGCREFFVVRLWVDEEHSRIYLYESG